MVVMKLLEVLIVFRQRENMLFLLNVFYFKKTNIYLIENNFINFSFLAKPTRIKKLITDFLIGSLAIKK